MNAVGISVLRRLQTGKGFEIAYNKEFAIERQVELEVELEPGEYVVVPRTTGCNLRKPDSHRSDQLSSLLTPSGDLHPHAVLALNDLFRRLDTLTLDGALSFTELSTFFARLSLPFTQDSYQTLLRAHCPGHTEHGLDRRAFCEWWR